MQYEVTVLSVKDADAIVINYDAGNVGDSAKIKTYVKHKENNRFIVDYAFCTHPDKDHKGGFFELLSDQQVDILHFFIRRPDTAMSGDMRRLFYEPGKLEAAAKAVYNHPTDPSINLIDKAVQFSSLVEPSLGQDVPGIPLMMVGPTESFFKDACYEMALNFAELEDELGGDSYAEDELPSDEDAQSVMDEVKETSATNKSSMILLFHPEGCNFLLSGDACSESLKEAVEEYPQSIPGCVLKVPHHGSKHNLTTEVIDLIRPSSAVISCCGTKKHPNPSVVHFLSKHCNVYSTHKCVESLTYKNTPIDHPAEALRKKQE